MQLWDSPNLGALAALAGALHVESLIPGPHPCRPSSEGGGQSLEGSQLPSGPTLPQSEAQRSCVCTHL